MAINISRYLLSYYNETYFFSYENVCKPLSPMKQR